MFFEAVYTAGATPKNEHTPSIAYKPDRLT